MNPRVSIVKCKTYNPEEVQFAVDKAIELLGGITSFVKTGETVLIKPNILGGSPPEHGINTHIEIVRALIRLVKKCGSRPFIGDNPGGSMSASCAYEQSGFLSLAKEEQIEIKEVKNIRIVNGIPIASYFFECDKIISVPKMKTHSLTVITGAIKNMFGAVAGLSKSEFHKKFPNPKEFAGILVDVFEKVQPHLTLMDGVVLMEGDGPSAGKLRRAGLLVAGEDSVALDSIFSKLIGIEPAGILTTKEAYRRALGEMNLENIEVLGEKIEESFIDRFELPRTSLHLKIINTFPGKITKALAALIKFKPYIDEKLCKKCNICQESCPVSAITIRADYSRIDYRKCIKCMCCHEVCPYKATDLKRNFLAKGFGL